MALRASSSSAIRAAKTEGAPRATATRVLPIDLTAILSPYKKKHFALRIERVPQRARFSAGRKNGDNSWSLTREETNELEYLLPEEVATAHTIAIRILDLDAAGGTTLKLVEYPVKIDDASAPVAGEEVVTTAAPSNDAEVQRLRDELAALKATQGAPRDNAADAKLAAANAELDRLRQELEASNAREAKALADQEHEIATHLAEARADFAAELERRMGMTTSATTAEVQRHRAAWQTEFAATQEQWRKDAASALAAAEQNWKQQAAKSLAEAELSWKAEEAQRLTAREAEWQKTLADVRSAQGASNDAHGTEITELKQKVAALEASLADRDVVLAESQKAAEAADAAAATELKETLAKAEQTWKDAEAKRVSALEAEWQAKVAAAAKTDAPPPPPPAIDPAKEEELKQLRAQLADAKTAHAKAESDWKDAEAKRVTTLEAEWQAKLAASKEAARKAAVAPPAAATNDEELKDLRAQAAQFKQTLADYDAAMSQAQKAAVEAMANTDRRVSEALTKAEQSWKDAEAARAAAKDADWQAKLKKSVDDAGSKVPPPVVTTAPVSANADELAALRNEIEELQTTLIDRDATIERLESEAADPKAPTHPEIQDELVKAERLWNAGEAERIAAAQSQARLDQQRELNDAKSRYEQAEAALAHMRIRASDDNRAHNEVSTLRATLGVREREIHDLKKQLDDMRGYVAPEQGGDFTQTHAPESETKPAPKYSRDIFIAGAVGIVLVAGFTFFGDVMAPVAPPAPEAPKVAAVVAPPPVVELPKSVIAKNGKVRANAEANAEVIARVTTGNEVTELERKGAWARVRLAPEGNAAPIEGWVYVSVLKEKPANAESDKQKAK